MHVQFCLFLIHAGSEQEGRTWWKAAQNPTVYILVATGRQNLLRTLCLEPRRNQKNDCGWKAKLTSALAFQSLLVTCCTSSLTFNNCRLCPHCIYVFFIYLRTNCDLCHLQHKLTGFYNRDEKCLLCGTNWVFKGLKTTGHVMHQQFNIQQL